MEGVVASFAHGTVKGLIEKLGSILADEALLLGRVRAEIQYIKDELESMHGFLIEQAQKEDHDHQVKIWMKQVREMAYDAEDCIDKFRYRVDKPCRKGLSGIIRKSAHVLKTLKARHQIATEVQDLRRRTREVSERQLRYLAPAGVTSMRAYPAGYSLISYPQLQALYPEQVQPVGFDKSRDQIIGWLMDNNRPQLTVISIVGFGGLGKTTLAKMAYESPTVKARNFECRAFIAVSQRFDIKLLLSDIFRQVQWFSNKGAKTIRSNEVSNNKNEQEEEHMVRRKSLENMENWNLPTLISKLREYLNNTRNGSRIIVTTRIESVANECSRDHEPCVYKMEPLDLETSKMLFYKIIFGTNEQFPNGELEQTSNNILKKCGGMPLAISSVAGLLASKPKQPKLWETILNSLGSELETNPTLEGMRKILFLSYHDLPHYLKTCFLYLSIYPEDYKIRRKCLLRRWIAEGFVSRKRGLSAEEVAESYLYELVNRNMVIPIDISITGEIRSIHVHDMMLEIIVSKSLEENFVSLVGGEYNLIHDKIRRLSVHSVGENNLMPSININLAHIRSLSIFGNSKEWMNSKQLRLVRVLDLEGNKDICDGDLKYLCKMFQLKYLSLRGTPISQLPPKIRKLQNLETIDIRETYIRKLPSDIIELQNLIHFYCGSRKYKFFSEISFDYLKLPQGVKNMKNIQTLTQISLNMSCSVIQELGELVQITKLEVVYRGLYCNQIPDCQKEEKIWRSFCSALEKLSMSLRTLTIWNDKSENYSMQFLDLLKSPPTLLKSLDLLGYLEKLPYWFPSLNNLTELKLYRTRLHEEDFEVLQKLPNLLHLHQAGQAYCAKELLFVEEAFPSLRVFVLENIKIPTLRFRERTAPKLEILAVTFIFEPEKFWGIEYLQSLKEFTLKISKVGDFDKVMEDLKNVTDLGQNKFKFTVEYF